MRRDIAASLLAAFICLCLTHQQCAIAADNEPIPTTTVDLVTDLGVVLTEADGAHNKSLSRKLLGDCNKCNLAVCNGGCKCDNNCNCRSGQGASVCDKCNMVQSSGGCKCDQNCNCLSGTCSAGGSAGSPTGGGSPGGGSAGSPAGGSSSRGCPAGWSVAVGTVYDSWPRPGTTECVDYSGCRWAGQFSNISPGPAKGPCLSGAKMLDGGIGNVECRWPEASVKSWNMASTYGLDKALLNKKLEVMVEGKPGVSVTVQVLDVCADSDCGGCCKKNTGNKAFKLIDLEKWPASELLGFNANAANFDVNSLQLPNAKGLRPGAPELNVMPLCYRVLGDAPCCPPQSIRSG